MRGVAARSRKCLTAEARGAIAAFIASRRCDDGGYAGKSSASDLYYTFFAAGALDALGRRRALLSLPRYLARFRDGAGLDFVHAVCLARLLGGLARRGRQRAVLARVEAFRSRDGGYHHATPNAETGSAYALYLALEAYAGAGPPLPGLERIPAALESLRAGDGSYANEAGSPRGQSNATAAACLTRRYLGLAPEPACIDFLLQRHDPASGGFHAYPDARIPDLLSTASALYTLNVMGVALEPIAASCRAFIETLWTDDGGFRGTMADPDPDCEYTCYALLGLGALS